MLTVVSVTVNLMTNWFVKMLKFIYERLECPIYTHKAYLHICIEELRTSVDKHTHMRYTKLLNMQLMIISVHLFYTNMHKNM